MNLKDYDKQIYNSAYNFLLNQKDIETNQFVTKEIIDLQFIPSNIDHNNMSDIYFRLLESAQNKQMSTKVIGNSINGVKNFSKVLFDFNVNKVSKEYPVGSEDRLIANIINILKPKGELRQSNQSLWPQYCKTITSAASFLSKFDSYEEFIDMLNHYDKDERIRASLPLVLSLEIHGIGFPLACDFLKELGYTKFGKPDVHLKYIFNKLDLLKDTTTSSKNLDYYILKTILRIAKNVKVEPFQVDKIFWLIGSGKFYAGEKEILNIGRRREEFVELVYKQNIQVM